MRDNRFLAKRLQQIWQRYFFDIIPKNEIYIRFGRKSHTRLGSISQEAWPLHPGVRLVRHLFRRKPRTIITLNGHFKKQKIPLYVIDGTIAHELTHYAHGFASPHKQAFRYPHAGGVVTKELQRRGLDEVLQISNAWIKTNWRKII